MTTAAAMRPTLPGHPLTPCRPRPVALRPREVDSHELCRSGLDPDLAIRLEGLWEGLSPAWQTVLAAAWRVAGETGEGVLAMYTAPGAPTGHHHGYVGGLIEHTIEVAEIARHLAEQPANATATDPGVVVAGALLHDIGKTWTYRWDGSCRRSGMGRRVTHIEVGLGIIDHALLDLARRGADLPPEHEVAEVRHIVRSHHGVPRPPRTVGALAVHLADTSSAGLAVMRESRTPTGRRALGASLGVATSVGHLVRRIRRRMGLDTPVS